jgi:regulation of enolase protein 1 (concanavalin A-like superfamily)
VTDMAEHAGLARVPVALRWAGGARDTYQPGDDRLTIGAGPRTDLFVNPQRTAEVVDAPRLLASAQGDFLLSTRVHVGAATRHDAGGLLVWLNDRAWAKLGLELSAQREPEIVSVVTRGASDRASGFVVRGEHVWLRVARVGGAYAFHASLDGEYWRLIRHFALYAPDSSSYGFFAQSPAGEGCSAVFDHIAFERRRLTDLLDGS